MFKTCTRRHTFNSRSSSSDPLLTFWSGSAASCSQAHILYTKCFNFPEKQMPYPCKIYTPPPHTHTHTFNGPLSRTTRVSQYQKGKTNIDFTEARDSQWQWHQLGHMQVCTSLQTDNHISTPPLCFSQAGCPSCHSTNSVKALKANN